MQYKFERQLCKFNIVTNVIAKWSLINLQHILHPYKIAAMYILIKLYIIIYNNISIKSRRIEKRRHGQFTE